MTIHDIIVNCGSFTANTLIIICDCMGVVKCQCAFKNLEIDYENLKINFFTVGVLSYSAYYGTELYFKFYV